MSHVTKASKSDLRRFEIKTYEYILTFGFVFLSLFLTFWDSPPFMPMVNIFVKLLGCSSHEALSWVWCGISSMILWYATGTIMILLSITFVIKLISKRNKFKKNLSNKE